MARREPREVLEEFENEYANLLAVLDPNEALQRTIARIPELVGLQMAFAGLAGPDGSMVIGHINEGTSEALRGLHINPGHGAGGKVLATGRPAWVSDYGSAGDITHHYDKVVVEEAGIRGLVAVPLQSNGRVLGVLYAATPHTTAFGDRAADALRQIADRAGTAVAVAERARHAAEVAAHEERRRIAMSLHDTVGATLFALTATVRSLGDDLRADPVLRAKVDAIAERAKDATAALRESLAALSATPQELVLGVTLRADCRAFQDRSGIPARVILMDELPAVAVSRAEVLVAVVREALLNVEKHARARSVVITAFPVRDGLSVAVTDDGVGLDNAQSDGLGLGLAAAADRLQRVGGTLTLADNDDGGMTLRAWVPC